MTRTPRSAATGWQSELNFLITNRIPRQCLTRAFGWFSRLRSPWIARPSIAIWRRLARLSLHEAADQQFASVHDCFIRALKPGARPIDPDPDTLVSPCDAIIGTSGAINGVEVFQAKGLSYTLPDLLGDPALAESCRDGHWATLRITASMYHRFHAPADCRIDEVVYLSGDTWNVNPPALARIERLFCRNERAVIRCRLAHDLQPLLLVPVAAVLVASIRLHFADVRLHLRYKGPNRIPCAASAVRGEELGWFEHGSTILVFTPPGWRLAPSALEGTRIRMGEALFRRAR
jgi:phosphatidylserine decarboxylase